MGPSGLCLTDYNVTRLQGQKGRSIKIFGLNKWRSIILYYPRFWTSPPLKITLNALAVIVRGPNGDCRYFCINLIRISQVLFFSRKNTSKFCLANIFRVSFCQCFCLRMFYCSAASQMFLFRTNSETIILISQFVV